jgi:hypothetical protein
MIIYGHGNWKVTAAIMKKGTRLDPGKVDSFKIVRLNTISHAAEAETPASAQCLTWMSARAAIMPVILM